MTNGTRGTHGSGMQTPACPPNNGHIVQCRAGVDGGPLTQVRVQSRSGQKPTDPLAGVQSRSGQGPTDTLARVWIRNGQGPTDLLASAWRRNGQGPLTCLAGTMAQGTLGTSMRVAADGAGTFHVTGRGRKKTMWGRRDTEASWVPWDFPYWGTEPRTFSVSGHRVPDAPLVSRSLNNEERIRGR